MTVIDKNTILLDRIYISKPGTTEEPVFAYPRFLKNGELGFSVLDTASRTPDFSNCSVIWVRPEDFPVVFMPIKDINSFLRSKPEMQEDRKEQSSAVN